MEANPIVKSALVNESKCDIILLLINRMASASQKDPKFIDELQDLVPNLKELIGRRFDALDSGVKDWFNRGRKSKRLFGI